MIMEFLLLLLLLLIKSGMITMGAAFSVITWCGRFFSTFDDEAVDLLFRFFKVMHMIPIVTVEIITTTTMTVTATPPAMMDIGSSFLKFVSMMIVVGKTTVLGCSMVVLLELVPLDAVAVVLDELI